MKPLIPILVILMCVSAVADNSVSGSYQGENYSFTFSPDFNEISGTWGTLTYDISVQPDFDEISGQIANSSVDLRMEPDFHDASGSAPCGSIDLAYETDFGDITGTYCGQSYSQKFDNKNEVQPTFVHLINDAVLQNFPFPVHMTIREFIRQRIKF